MAFDYSISNLIQSIRDVTNANSSIQDWPDVKIVRLLNRMVHSYMVPLIGKARKEFFDTFTDIPLVAAQNSYYLPSKAVGGKLRAVQLVDASGNPYSSLVEYDLERAINFGASFLTGTLPQAIPIGYWFRGNQLVLYPTPAATPALTLRAYFLNRPSTLVLNSACIQSTSISTGSGNFTVNFSGTIPTGYPNTTVVDVVQSLPGFDVLLTGPIASQTASSVTITGTKPANMAAGDWVCIADTAPVVTGAIPDIVVGCLIRKVALEIEAGKGDDATFNRNRVLLSHDEKEAVFFLRRRNEGEHKKVGGYSLMRFRRGALAPFS